jgi:hypothetical protein
VGLAYEGNPRHRDPWQQGARGSRCPKGANGPDLLSQSVPDPKNSRRRFATDGADAFQAKPTNTTNAEGDEVWHGFPVNWNMVPIPIRRQWITENVITPRVLKGGRS